MKYLKSSNWDLYNIIAHINAPSDFDEEFHEDIIALSKQNNLLTPKDVAYTIFPFHLYNKSKNTDEFYSRYNKERGFFHRVMKLKPGWGTYFRRMSCYERDNENINQLDNIIKAINKREKNSHAAFTIVIQKPGGETVKPLGGPCLNYLALQIEWNEGERGKERVIGLLCVYRNHDFLKRAYGNYWGLSKLLEFIAKETTSNVGPITCVSSHAYVADHKKALSEFIESYD